MSLLHAPKPLHFLQTPSPGAITAAPLHGLLESDVISTPETPSIASCRSRCCRSDRRCIQRVAPCVSALRMWWFRKASSSVRRKTYGTLAAAIALMVWLYWTAFAVLLGGEINADLLHAAGKHIPAKEPQWTP